MASKTWLSVLALGFSLAAQGAAADFEKELVAYAAGDGQELLNERTPFSERGNASVQNNLGVSYVNGQGVARDHAEAMRRYHYRNAGGVAATKLIAVASLDPMATEAAGKRFLGATTEVFAAPDPESAVLGSILVASPITLGAGRADGWREVRLSGWTQAGAERAIYAAPGLRVLRAALGKDAVGTLAFFETRTDPETGQDWARTTLTGWVQGADLAANIAPIWARAENLFATRCTACHQRRIPEHYTANQWTSYLKVMGPRTGLPKDDQFLIRVYLQHLSSDAAVLAEVMETAPDADD